MLAAISGPLQSWFAAAAAKVGDPARRESLDAVLLGVFHVLGRFASVLPGLGAALAAAAVALLFFFWFGVTTLTLSFAAIERVYAVRGHNRFLFEFSETLSERLAARED